MRRNNSSPNIVQLDPHISRFASGRVSTILSRAPLAGVRTYFRPKTFNAHTGINRLTTAATPLLSLATRLKETPHYSDIQTLHQHLSHEISAFETSAHKYGYRSETILIARYILCTMLDEFIVQTPWGNHSQWDDYRLLVTFQKESWGGDRLFLILERMSEDPVIHIDLLELIYVCLSLGVEGKFRYVENGKIQLEKIIENLYQLIRWQRGEIKKDLLIQTDTSLTQKKAGPRRTQWLFITILSSIILWTTYMGLNYLLNSPTTSSVSTGGI